MLKNSANKLAKYSLHYEILESSVDIKSGISKSIHYETILAKNRNMTPCLPCPKQDIL